MTPRAAFAVKATLGAGLLFALASAASDRYSVGFTVADEQCLPFTLFLIDKGDQDVPIGGYVAFLTAGLERFPDGRTFVKQHAGQAGDRVTVDASGIRINGVHHGDLLGEYVERLGKPQESYFVDRELDTAEHYVLGTLERSYDSRYWGAIRSSQIVGRAYPLW
jgi:conjugal transfer pilin signal peptidase TrbI